MRTCRLSAALLAGALLVGGPFVPRAMLGAQGSDRPIDSGIRELLQQYSGALESLDAAAVKKTQPAIDVESLKKAFKDMRSLAVTIDEIKILSNENNVARISCRVTQTLTPKAGSKRTTAVTRVMRVRRAGTAWVIDGFER
jgi:hypothetical protein